MFENLNEIREAWTGNNPVIVDTEVGNYLTLPLQLVNSVNLELFYIMSYEGIFIVLPFKIQKDLEIPTYEILGRSISSTYPIMTQLFRNNHSSKNSSLSIGLKSDLNLSNSQFLVKLGDAFENYLGHSISKNEMKKEFYSITMVPGSFNLMKSSFESLKISKNIAELSIELADIAKYPGAVLITKIPDDTIISDTGYVNSLIENSKIIDEKTIINLWRSMNKIDREEIGYLE